MKAVIPVAGIGKRLRPQTITVPKALLNVAGKPILGYIVDSLIGMGVTELILIIGYRGDMIREYMTGTYDVETHFVVQEEQQGIAQAVSLARPYADGSVLMIILGDTIIETDFSSIPRAGDHVLGVREVVDPRRFGICEINGDVITNIVEKPKKPKSNLALVGLYYLRDSTQLFETCAELIEKNIKTKGEYQITDALQLMIERGVEFRPLEIEGWYDCGKVETLLETNRVLLDKSKSVYAREGSIIVSPCYIDSESEITGSIIGPYVSIARGCRVSDSIIKNSILNEGSVLEYVVLNGSVVGAYAEVIGSRGSFNISDYSKIDFHRREFFLD
jgi:glucose-1-phosphate thymidylyltransferase